MKRSRIRPISPRRIAYLEELEQMRPLVEARAHHRCETRYENCLGPLTVHHRLRRSQGGSNDLANLLYVCAKHHRQIHDNPAVSYLHGYLLRRVDNGSKVVQYSTNKGEL